MEIKTAVKAFAALSTDIRLIILKRLVKEGKDGLCPCHLLSEYELSNANLSFHLKELENAGLIGKTKKGKYIHYHANCDFIKEIGDFIITDCAKYGCKQGCNNIEKKECKGE